jgi:putative DNA primase/helicase
VAEGVLQPALREAIGLEPRLRDDLISDVRKCETAPGETGVLGWAQSLEPFAVTVADLDADSWLLNTASGTLDLRTGHMRAHDPADLLTKVTGAGVDPAASGDVFARFLAEILPDPAVRDFVQRLFGVALIGRVIEHVLPIFTGVGRNGKSTLLNVIRAALGDYAIEAEPDLLIERDRAHPTGLMDLRGVRLAVCQESDDGRRLAVGTVKRLTGGDAIRARGCALTSCSSTPPTRAAGDEPQPRVPGDDPRCGAGCEWCRSTWWSRPRPRTARTSRARAARRAGVADRGTRQVRR